jgi:hypothetical protein
MSSTLPPMPTSSSFLVNLMRELDETPPPERLDWEAQSGQVQQ